MRDLEIERVYGECRDEIDFRRKSMNPIRKAEASLMLAYFGTLKTEYIQIFLDNQEKTSEAVNREIDGTIKSKHQKLATLC